MAAVGCALFCLFQVHPVIRTRTFGEWRETTEMCDGCEHCKPDIFVVYRCQRCSSLLPQPHTPHNCPEVEIDEGHSDNEVLNECFYAKVDFYRWAGPPFGLLVVNILPNGDFEAEGQ